MRKLVFSFSFGAVLLGLALALPELVIAVSDPGAGQPDADCDTFTALPGHSGFAMGSAFTPGGIAGSHICR